LHSFLSGTFQVTISAQLVPAFNCNSVLKEAIKLASGCTDIVTLHIELPLAHSKVLVKRLSGSCADQQAQALTSNTLHVRSRVPCQAPLLDAL
jgi:hypothetical protein